MAQIIVQEEYGQWRAWFPESPQASSGGTSLKGAMGQLLRDNGLDAANLHLQYHGASARRHVFRFENVICQDCRGTGKYVGFQAVEDCKACSGRGYRS